MSEAAPSQKKTQYIQRNKCNVQSRSHGEMNLEDSEISLKYRGKQKKKHPIVNLEFFTQLKYLSKIKDTYQCPHPHCLREPPAMPFFVHWVFQREGFRTMESEAPAAAATSMSPLWTCVGEKNEAGSGWGTMVLIFLHIFGTFSSQKLYTVYFLQKCTKRKEGVNYTLSLLLLNVKICMFSPVRSRMFTFFTSINSILEGLAKCNNSRKNRWYSDWNGRVKTFLFNWHAFLYRKSYSVYK